MTAGEMGAYVAEAFFTYEQMREDRDQWRGRAEVAEQELAAAFIAARETCKTAQITLDVIGDDDSPYSDSARLTIALGILESIAGGDS